MAESKPDKLDVAARCISSTIRWAAARGRAAELAKQVYFKYSSEAHDKPYYYNSLLQTTTWKKPKLLWKFDVPYEDGEEKEELGTMDGTPFASAPLAHAPSTGKLVWGVDTSLVQLGFAQFPTPFRQKVTVSFPSKEHQDLRIFVFSAPWGKLSRFDLRQTESPYFRCGLLADFARTRPVLEFTEWKSLLTFYASFSPQAGMTAFHVFYSHSPLRAIVTTEPTAGVVWKKYFTFYGYEGIKLEVRQHPARENSYCVALPGTLDDWKPCFSFVALTKEAPGTTKLHVFERHDPHHRFKVTPSTVPSRQGWYLSFSFYAFSVPLQGSMKFEIQNKPHVSESRIANVFATSPWQTASTFYAFPV